jgi:hypothetical protein
VGTMPVPPKPRSREAAHSYRYPPNLRPRPQPAANALTLTRCRLPPRCAAEIGYTIGEEIERLRAAGTEGVHRIRVKDKDYDIDLDTHKTLKDGREWLEHLYPCAFGCAAICLISLSF